MRKRSKNRDIVCVLAVMITSLVMLAACENNNKDEVIRPTKVDQIKDAGEIVMITNAAFPPYEFYGEGGAIQGIDVEIGQRIAENLGVKLTIVNENFDTIVDSIAEGKGDMAITGLTIDAERQALVDFSVPYVDSIQYLILSEDSDIKAVEDLDEKSIGVQVGTTGAKLVKNEIETGVLSDKDVQCVSYQNAPLAMQDLTAGEIDAVVIDELVAQMLSAQNRGYKAGPFAYRSGSPVTEQYGVAIEKGNAELLKVINESINQILADGKIGEWTTKYSIP